MLLVMGVVTRLLELNFLFTLIHLILIYLNLFSQMHGTLNNFKHFKFQLILLIMFQHKIKTQWWCSLNLWIIIKIKIQWWLKHSLLIIIKIKIQLWCSNNLWIMIKINNNFIIIKIHQIRNNNFLANKVINNMKDNFNNRLWINKDNNIQIIKIKKITYKTNNSFNSKINFKIFSNNNKSNNKKIKTLNNNNSNNKNKKKEKEKMVNRNSHNKKM